MCMQHTIQFFIKMLNKFTTKDDFSNFHFGDRITEGRRGIRNTRSKWYPFDICNQIYTGEKCVLYTLRNISKIFDRFTFAI